MHYCYKNLKSGKVLPPSEIVKKFLDKSLVVPQASCIGLAIKDVHKIFKCRQLRSEGKGLKDHVDVRKVVFLVHCSSMFC